MWMHDLEKAIGRVTEFLGPRACSTLFESIKPSYDGGIIFKTTSQTFIKWFSDGTVIEREEGAWRR